MVSNNRKVEKRKPKRQHNKGQLLNLAVPLMLICLGLWIDMERDKDSSIHVSDGTPSLDPFCAPVKQS